MGPPDASNESVDQRLTRLALVAQQKPPGSVVRRIALAKLFRELQRSRKLVRPYRGQFKGFYEDIYAEAQQRLFVYLCEHIDRFNPDAGEFLQWANFLMKRRFFIEASREIFPSGPKGINPKQNRTLSLDDLDRIDRVISHDSQTQSPTEAIIQCIQDDPDDQFKQAFTSKKTQANFQFIALQIIAGYSWKEISADLGIPISTLSSFYQTSLRRFAPVIRAYI